MAIWLTASLRRSSLQKKCSKPPNTVICHCAAGLHFRLETVAVLLRYDRILRSVHGADSGFDVARFRWQWGQQISVQTDNGLNVGARTRESEHIAAAETDTNGSPSI